MTSFNFRSLLLAAIVLCNCITWTASRHHYTHNVHQHRTRHRRQGKGLYLSASYVIPGGEGSGWGEWGDVSPCSRTCGGGVASQKRICLQFGRDGQPECSGGDTKYFSCETQDCPPGSTDFRAEQCAEFDDKDFRGFRYNWVPYTKAPNPCELNCMPHGERFYFRHKSKVIDGTRCNDASFDVCVDGTCQPVGCDMMLGSNAREDKCRECRGTGANCHTTAGIFDSQDLLKGYNDILLIPQGSTTIVIEEIEPSNNYLALRAKNGTYYLNGHYHIDFPRSIMIAGALWYYERSQQGYAAPDKLRCLGPTSEPLYLSLLLQDDNVGIRYEYSVPNESAPPTDKRYNWVHEDFAPCSATCGGGFQTRNVTCRSREELELVDDSLCDEGLKPVTNQTCSPDPCPAQWVEGPWGECSKRCGSGGVKSREVTCQKIIANGYPSIVADKECFDLLGPKPELFQECNQDAPCPTWFAGPWKPCDKLCDEGKQTRQVVCYQKKDGRIEVLEDEDCTDEKPKSEQKCLLQPCDGVDWITTDWAGCNTCNSKIRTRLVMCSTKDQQVLNETFCSYHPRPIDQEDCDPAKLPPCEVQWYATQWTNCSVDCGEGVQTRKVFCGLYDGDKVSVVEDAKCADLPKYKDTKPCSVPTEECPEKWFAGPWTVCTKECGGGEQYRRVMCYRGDKESNKCESASVLDSTQLCNMGPCNLDEMLPINSSSTPIMDDEECDYDADYPEVGLEEDLLSRTTLDIMMSDGPGLGTGYAEHESSWTTDTGSGFGSSLTTDDLTSLEGSGFSSLSTKDTTDMSITVDIDYTTDNGNSTDDYDFTGETSKTTKTTVGSESSEETGTTATAETGSTESTVTDVSSSSGSSETGNTGTEVTMSTVSGVTSSTDGTDDTATTENTTGSSDEDSVTTVSGETDITANTTGSTDSTSEVSGATDISTEETPTSGKTDSTVTEKTDSTVSGATNVTANTEKSGSTEETATTVSGDTDSTVTEKTDSTVSGATDATTENTGSTEKTDSTVSSGTDETATTGDITTNTGSTETENTDSTVSSSTEETASTGDTESTVSENTSPTESTVSEKTESTETEITNTATTGTEDTSSTGSTEESGSTGTDSTTGPTGSTESTHTTARSDDETTKTTVLLSTDSTRITARGDDETTKTTVSLPTENTGSTTDESTVISSTQSSDSSETTVASTGSSESSDETTTSSVTESTVSGPTSEGTQSTAADVGTTGSDLTTESSTLKSDSTTEISATSEASGTSLESTGTTEESSTITSDSTTEVTGTSSSEISVTETSTASGYESTVETTESISTIGSESTTEQSGSTTEGSTAKTTVSVATDITSTEATGSTESIASTGTEESTTSVYSTTEVSGSTEGLTTTESLSTTGGSTTEGIAISTGKTPRIPFGTNKQICKSRRKLKCDKSQFGCCPDKKTAAAGPFDEGCPKPRTCKESTYGCCPNGVSPAQGDNNEGCPIEPCAETLFGCCLSDNKTAAQGNDQDGCPPPPPACQSSKFGCCADNETEASGPEKEGCPESETTTTAEPTETTVETSETSGASEASEGTTSEGSTTSGGTTDGTGSTTLEVSLCAESQFGCCYDNETEASGPDGQGCPCNATEFGCCPDGVSPAQGIEGEGCPRECSTSEHGCCQDGKTPAHGPDYEGCCLLEAFGCCPDNRRPAAGPHLEGCGCQYAPHGCCPDNVTIAQGPENQGCGCQYTEHGCCPDRHTAALGPKNEGCGCNTFQFGCCSDGVTTARGPDKQGCHCRTSKYGCCGDGVTHATGPDGAGCDCSSSQYGCCPDGLTAAPGPKFLGCTDAPENKQAVCSLPTDPGPCHNFTATWFYDMEYGGCSRFWYGGCDGNGNRFASKEECEDVCVQPAPKDACKLPSVKGPCDANFVRWHYNSTREQCIAFRYGGCLGNNNNFDTVELCQKQCEPARVTGQCNLPIEQGSCAGNFSRWGFNTETHRCEQFIWGGCDGNPNRFSTEAACQMECDPPGALKPQCTEPQEAGNCTEKEALWSFSQSENRCVPFYYSGCGGNGNRFNSREACEQSCPSAYVPDKCTLPAETGPCSNYREKWFFDTTIKRCRQFYYGGCGGNENNFGTEVECDNTCSELRTTTTTTARPTEPQPAPQPQPEPQQPEREPQQPEPEPARPDFCFLAIDAGPCTNTETRYAYDSSLGRCTTFEYGGCGGNQNNFPNDQYCTYYCHPIQDICQLPMLSGPCEESLMRWFYDPSKDSCSQFTYGGCEGNENRFETREACERRCRTGPAETTLTTTLRTTITTPASTTVAIGSRFGEDVPPECRIPESLEECSYAGQVWYFDQRSRECVSHLNQDIGVACRTTGTFSSQEACERSCGAFRGVDVCQQGVDPGPCQEYVTKVYFDAASGQCNEFAYGGCLGGANRFSTVEECQQICNAEIDPCTLPPDQGNCFSNNVQWYYDPTRDQCNQFMYTGCSGNANRFESQNDCEARCKRPAPVTTTIAAPVVPPQQTAELECTTPSSLVPCGENVTVFYYNSERQECLASGIGGCEHPNSYNTEEECLRRCGAFREFDVCKASLDPGPCRASIPKFYWDAASGSCQPFAFGGCAGGPNRFSTIEECENYCGATGPAPACLQAVDSGEYCDSAPGPRWHYDVARGDCIVFTYLGCGGNTNHFYSYEECASFCRIPETRGNDSNEVLPPDCDELRKECDVISCTYGIKRVVQDGCTRCICKEDPCITANCTAGERCVAAARRNPVTQEPEYSATCVADHETNEVLPDCETYVAECAALACPYGKQRTRTSGGCERCTCVPIDIDCEPLKDECEKLECTYGMQSVMGPDGCQRCRCNDHPCANKNCADGERCVVNAYKDAVEQDLKYSADCRIVVKPGMCPIDETPSNDALCRHECSDDADCRGVGKCCRRGCSDLCLAPVDPTTTIAPDVPAPPQVIPQQEPEVAAAEGGRATLRCLFHGNPPPKITWRRGELTIDGSVGRYRLTSDGALEIVSLYRNDTGVYICVADNGLGVAQQEIHLVVNDPEQTPVGIAGDENAVVTGELDKPLVIRCLAYGYPAPSVFWYRGIDGTMVPYNDAMYEARGNVLLIRNLAVETLGDYTCQAYNGMGKAASWVVQVRAYRPEGILLEHEYVVPRYTSSLAKTQAPTTRETTTTTTTTTEAPIPLFTVPVSTHVSALATTLGIGAELRLTCEVDGFPEPDVYWTKDGARIQPDERTSISGSTIVSRLAVSRLSVSDSGLYACHASNPYSSHSDTTQINVQQQMVPAKCTDNPFFANCDLIVRSKFCRHKYYSKFCCKSCVEAGQLAPEEAELQADQPFRRK